MALESFNIILCKYKDGVYTLDKLIEFVNKNILTEEEFHLITSYSFKGIKKIKGID